MSKKSSRQVQRKHDYETSSALAAAAALAGGALGVKAQFVGQELGTATFASATLSFDTAGQYASKTGKMLVLAFISGSDDTIHEDIGGALRLDGSILAGSPTPHTCSGALAGNKIELVVFQVVTVVKGALHTYGVQAVPLAGTMAGTGNGAMVMLFEV